MGVIFPRWGPSLPKRRAKGFGAVDYQPQDFVGKAAGSCRWSRSPLPPQSFRRCDHERKGRHARKLGPNCQIASRKNSLGPRTLLRSLASGSNPCRQLPRASCHHSIRRKDFAPKPSGGSPPHHLARRAKLIPKYLEEVPARRGAASKFGYHLRIPIWRDSRTIPA